MTTTRPTSLDFTLPYVYVSVSDSEARAETYAETKRFFIIPGRIHLVNVLLGDDIGPLLTDFEETLYTYGTERSALFHNRVLLWQKIGWAIMSIPARDEERAKNFFALRRRHLDRDMRFAALADGTLEQFPFGGEAFRLVRPEQGRVYTVMKE